jgi:hypothetical protein
MALCLIAPVAAFGQGAPSDPPKPDETTAAPADTADGPDTSVDPNGSASTVNAPKTTNPAAAAAPASNYVFPTNRQIFRYGYRGVAGVRTLGGSAVSAAWNTWVTNSPEEWHSNFSGWSKRFGAKVLDNGINQSTLVGLSIATHQDPIYYRCACTGFWPRTFHAIGSTYHGRNRQGDWDFSIARVTSPFVGPIITRNTIYPSRYDTVDGIKSGGYYWLGTIGWNMVREFFLKGPKW